MPIPPPIPPLSLEQLQLERLLDLSQLQRAQMQYQMQAGLRGLQSYGQAASRYPFEWTDQRQAAKGLSTRAISPPDMRTPSKITQSARVADRIVATMMSTASSLLWSLLKSLPHLGSRPTPSPSEQTKQTTEASHSVAAADPSTAAAPPTRGS